MNPQQKSISADLYFFLQSINVRYEGFVEGVGFVSSELVLKAAPQPRFPNQSRLGYTTKDAFLLPTFMPVVIPTVDTDPRFAGVTESDVLRVVKKKNLDGSLRVNLGHNKIVTLAPESFVNVRIKEEVFYDKRQKIVTIFARDAQTGSMYNSQIPLNFIVEALKEDPPPLRLPKGDGMPEPDSPGYNRSTTWGDAGRFVAYMGLALAVGQVVTYDEFLGIWLGRNGKFNRTSWGGNGATGGRDKYAYARYTIIRKFGTAMGGISLALTFIQWRKGDIGTGWALAQGASTGFTMASKTSVGLAWGFGWGILGPWVTSWDSYQRFKFNFYYDYWESVVGPPSDSNRELWKYFYENYKF